jgi:hypothetical protein
VGEFLVDLGVWDVAAGRNVEIVHDDPRRRARLGSEPDGNMARIPAGTEFEALDVGKGEAGQDRDAVIAFHSGVDDVRIPHAPELGERHAVVRTLRFLQAEDVRAIAGEIAGDLILTQPHRVDVPRRDRRAARGLLRFERFVAPPRGAIKRRSPQLALYPRRPALGCRAPSDPPWPQTPQHPLPPPRRPSPPLCRGRRPHRGTLPVERTA